MSRRDAVDLRRERRPRRAFPRPAPRPSSDLDNPTAVALDGAGALYIADATNDLVEKVTSGGTLSVLAGDGPLSAAADPGPATSSALGSPVDVATDAAGDLYIADGAEDVVEKVTPRRHAVDRRRQAGQAGPPTPGPATSSDLSTRSRSRLTVRETSTSPTRSTTSSRR